MYATLNLIFIFIRIPLTVHFALTDRVEQTRKSRFFLYLFLSWESRSDFVCFETNRLWIRLVGVEVVISSAGSVFGIHLRMCLARPAHLPVTIRPGYFVASSTYLLLLLRFGSVRSEWIEFKAYLPRLCLRNNIPSETQTIFSQLLLFAFISQL